ncbi:MAG: hypothetical protein KDJ37_06700 [Hyphomicrobiaceae bacterium]|nr:hypothetical protein [Hyphomicrobiaceae bacterium]
MSDRTMLAIGRSNYSVSKLAKRTLQILLASLLTAFASFAILMINNVLTARSGWNKGFAVWAEFIQRSDIIGTIVLTAMVTVGFVYWQRDREREKR